MALLRPCQRIIRAFGKSLISCQIHYIRGFTRVSRTQGYVTVAPKFDCPSLNIEKSDIPINSTSNKINESISNNTIHWQLSQWCRSTKNDEIRAQDLLQIMKYCDGENNTTDSTGLALLRCCHMLVNVKLSNRRHLTDQTWNLIEKNVSVPTLEHYNTLLSVYVRTSETVDVKKFLNSMRVEPDVETHRLLLDCVAKSGDVESTLYVLSLMKKNGYSLNEGIFNSLIEAYATSGDVKSALKNINTMMQSGIPPSTQTWSIIACGYAKIADISRMMEILNSHSPSLEQILEIAKFLSLSGHVSHLPKVLKFLTSDMDLNNSTVNETITELTHAGQAEDAFAIVDRLTTTESTDERDSLIKNYLRNLVMAKTPVTWVLKIMNDIVVRKKYPFALTDVCGAALECGERELAMALFEMIHERTMIVRPHYYWPLLLQASKNDGEAEIFRTIKHMLCLNVRLDHDTLLHYVLPYVNTFDSLCTIRKFGDVGLESSILVTPLVCHLLASGRLNESLILCSKFKGTIDYSRILVPLHIAYRIKQNIDNCVQIFKHAPSGKHHADQFLMILYDEKHRKENVSIVDSFIRAFEAHEISVEKFCEARKKREANDGKEDTTGINDRDDKELYGSIPHPRDMNIEELECHLIELREKKMNTRGVMRRLFMLRCSQNNVARVEEIRKEYDDNGYLWTSGMYSSLLQYYIRNRRIDEARELYKEMREHHSDFVIDDVKIVRLANALIENNEIDEAIMILGSARSRGGPLLSRECWRLLNTVAHSKYTEMTESILDILVNAGYCYKTNAILGTLIRQHLLKNDLVKAVDTFQRLANQHKCTPLRQELINALLKTMKCDNTRKNESIEMLKNVQNVTAKIYGAANININLLVGLAQNGMREEMQRFFETNSVSNKVFTKRLANISEHDKLLILTGILDSCTNISQSQRIVLYEQILSVYSRSGNCKKAIELWDKISKEDRGTSRTFTMNFANLLEKHNVQLPADFEAS